LKAYKRRLVENTSCVGTEGGPVDTRKTRWMSPLLIRQYNGMDYTVLSGIQKLT